MDPKDRDCFLGESPQWVLAPYVHMARLALCKIPVSLSVGTPLPVFPSTSCYLIEQSLLCTESSLPGGLTGPHSSVKLQLLSILGKALKSVVLRTQEGKDAVSGLSRAQHSTAFRSPGRAWGAGRERLGGRSGKRPELAFHSFLH